MTLTSLAGTRWLARLMYKLPLRSAAWGRGGSEAFSEMRAVACLRPPPADSLRVGDARGLKNTRRRHYSPVECGTLFGPPPPPLFADRDDGAVVAHRASV